MSPDQTHRERPREVMQFKTRWGRVKCHDGEQVWFPNFFDGERAAAINGRETFVTLTFDEPIDLNSLTALQDKLKKAEEETAELKKQILNQTCGYCDFGGKIEKTLEAKDSTILKLKGCVEFYADKAVWSNGDESEEEKCHDRIRHFDLDVNNEEVIVRGGKLARATLKELGL